MARVTLKSQALVIAQLEAQVAELTTQVGVLMNALEESNQARKSLQDERDAMATVAIEIPDAIQESYAALVGERNDLIAENQRLVESCVAAHDRCDALEAIVAAKPQARPTVKAQPQPVRPASDDSAGNVTQITDVDRAIWAKFQRLSREERLEIIAFARPEFGHVGIHNIVEVRAAWHGAQPLIVAESEQELFELYGDSGDKYMEQYLNSIDPDMQPAAQPISA